MGDIRKPSNFRNTPNHHPIHYLKLKAKERCWRLGGWDGEEIPVMGGYKENPSNQGNVCYADLTQGLLH